MGLGDSVGFHSWLSHVTNLFNPFERQLLHLLSGGDCLSWVCQGDLVPVRGKTQYEPDSRGTLHVQGELGTSAPLYEDLTAPFGL